MDITTKDQIAKAIQFVKQHQHFMTREELTYLRQLAEQIYIDSFQTNESHLLPKVTTQSSNLTIHETKLNLPGAWDGFNPQPTEEWFQTLERLL